MVFVEQDRLPIKILTIELQKRCFIMNNIDTKDIWYDKTPAMSYNALINFIMGARGTGKTFGYKCWAVEENDQSVWMRRNQEDIDKLATGDKFFKDLLTENIITEDMGAFCDNNGFYIDGDLRIFFVALSTSRRVKSQSFAGVNRIIFDEIFEENKQTDYLRNEVEKFLSVYETINRLRLDGRPEVRVFMLGNKVSFVNPYFNYWNIQPFSKRFKTFKNGLILVENYKNEKFAELKRQTKFGQLIDGTKYGAYLIDNEVWQDDNAFIRKRGKRAHLCCNVRFESLTFGLWWDDYARIMYCCKDFNPNLDVFAPLYDCKDTEFPLQVKTIPMKWLDECYKNSRLYFDNNNIKYAVFSLLQGRWKQ